MIATVCVYVSSNVNTGDDPGFYGTFSGNLTLLFLHVCFIFSFYS